MIISDALLVTIVNAVRDVLTAGIVPTIAVVAAHIASKRRRKRNQSEVMEKLDRLASTIEPQPTAGALSDQVARLREGGSRPDDVAPPKRTA